MASLNPMLRFVGTLAIAGAVLGSFALLSGAIVRSRANGEEIRVTGSARKPIRSDLALWSARITYRAPDVNAAYESVKTGTDRLIEYLRKKGFTEAEIQRGALRTNKLYAASANGNEQASDTFRAVAGYDVTQSVEVQSGDVNKVEAISRESTELLASGIALESDPPRYIYTKISDVKREILGAAAEDCLRRAKEIAEKSGARVGKVRSVRMSPLQITSPYSSEVAAEGQNDTASLEKAITAIVTASFGID